MENDNSCCVCLEGKNKILCMLGCSHKHIICFDCITKVDKCPLCREKIIRNVIDETKLNKKLLDEEEKEEEEDNKNILINALNNFRGCHSSYRPYGGMARRRYKPKPRQRRRIWSRV